MNIKKLQQIGYSLSDIKDLLFLLKNNLKHYQTVFIEGDRSDILESLHKLKGGLRILHFLDIEEEITHLEKSINLKGVAQYKTQLISIEKTCSRNINTTLKKIEILLEVDATGN